MNKYISIKYMKFCFKYIKHNLYDVTTVKKQ